MNQIKKIIIVQSQVFFVRGGAEILAENLARQLRLAGYQVDICVIPYLAFRFRKIAMLFECFMWHFFKMRDATFREADVVIAIKFPTYYINHPNKIIWLAHQCRAVYDLRGTQYSSKKENWRSRFKYLYIRALDNRAFAKTKKIFAISQNVANRLIHYNRVPAEVLHPPLDKPEQYYTESYGDFLLYCGRLHPTKRVDLAINAMKFTKTTVKLIVAGTGDEETVSHLEMLINQHNLKDRVVLLGYVDQHRLLSLYANCFATIFPLYDEDYGFVTIESFQSRKPIICCNDSGGILEFVKDSINGYVCKPEPQVIADKIDFLFSDRDVCKQFGDAGYNCVKHLSWKNTIREIEKYF